MSETKPAMRAARPLSPHLQVYRFAWTMAMSIVHRITGAGLRESHVHDVTITAEAPNYRAE